jgi:hypothetical protein
LVSLGDPEVDYQDTPIAAEEDICGRNISVHEPERSILTIPQLMGVAQACRDLVAHPEDERNCEGLMRVLGLAEEPLEIDPFDELDDLKELIAAVVAAIALDDVGVLEAGGDVALIEEHRAVLVGVAELR